MLFVSLRLPCRAIRAWRRVRHGARGLTLIELLLALTLMGILAAIAGPIYFRQERQAQQTEARINLTGILISEVVFYSEHRHYSDFSSIGFALAGAANRYTYRSMQTTLSAGVLAGGPVQVLPARVGSISPDNSLVPVASGPGSFTATATANLDTDSTVDQWHVNELRGGLQQADTDDVTS